MAVYEQVVSQNYICKSSDTKPIARPGECLIEYDTGQQFIYNGSDWVEDLRWAVAFSQGMAI